MVCILSSTYSEPLHKIRFYTRAKQIPLRQHCTNCIGLILHRTVTIVSNLNGKTRSSKKNPNRLNSFEQLLKIVDFFGESSKWQNVGVSQLCLYSVVGKFLFKTENMISA